MRIPSLLLVICCTIGCTAEEPSQNDNPGKIDKHDSSPAQILDFEATAPDSGYTTLQAGLVGTMTGAAIRYDAWSNARGTVNFGFNWGLIHVGSHVFVSASEIDNGLNRFMGSAPYTVQNVVVKEGRVEFRIVIDWGSPLRISTDILTINP